MSTSQRMVTMIWWFFIMILCHAIMRTLSTVYELSWVLKTSRSAMILLLLHMGYIWALSWCSMIKYTNSHSFTLPYNKSSPYTGCLPVDEICCSTHCLPPAVELDNLRTQRVTEASRAGRTSPSPWRFQWRCYCEWVSSAGQLLLAGSSAWWHIQLISLIYLMILHRPTRQAASSM